MAFLHGEGLTHAIRDVVAAGPADIAVAFWGNESCQHLGLPADLQNYRIACDARSGFCSPETLKELQRRGALVVDVPSLHAKVYRSPDAMVVTSANASHKALSLDSLATYGLEAGILETDPKRLAAAGEWLEKLLLERRPIGPRDLAEIEASWIAQRASRPLRRSLTQALLTNAAELDDRDILVYVYSSEQPRAHHVKAYKQTLYFDAAAWDRRTTDPFFFGELPPTLEVGQKLLCFAMQEGMSDCEGVWQILDRVGTGDRAIWPAVAIDRPLGRRLGALKEIERRVSAAVRVGRIKVDADPMTLPHFAAQIAGDREEADHLARIDGTPAQAAYLHLARSAPKLGLSSSYKTGRVPAVRWHDDADDYLFSFIPNKNDLLFYVRHPSLRRARSLADEAARLGLEWNRNPAGEVTLRVRNPRDAATIADWLARKLPLPLAR